MATFNGRSWSFSDFSGASGYDYVGNWDPFWDDVIAEMSARAAAIGAGLVAVSMSSQTIGTGAKTFDVGPGKGFTPNMWVTATDMGNSANSLTGSVTSYNSNTGVLVLAVPLGATTGSGTIAAWSLGIGGKPGATGPAGAAGAGPVWSGTTAGTPNAQTLASPLASLSGNPSVEFIAGFVNGAVARTNLQPYSKQFDKAVWNKGSVTVTADAAAWIDGSVIMDKVKETAVSDYHAVQNIYLTGLSPTQTYTASIYLKAAERSKGRLVFFANGFADGVAATFDLTTGTVAAGNIGSGSGAAATIDALPGGIYRVSITGKLGGSNTSGGLYLNLRDDSGADAYMGVSGSGLYAVYGQLESGAVATPPIETGATAASVTDGHTLLSVGTTPYRSLLDAAGKALAPGAIAYGTKYVATYDGSSWRLAGGGGASVNLAATHAALFSI